VGKRPVLPACAGLPQRDRKDVDNFVDKQIPQEEKVCPITRQNSICRKASFLILLKSITCEYPPGGLGIAA
jgi:hypothetical protein